MYFSRRLIPALGILIAASACASLNKKETGAIIGAAAGGAAGAAVGNANGSTAKGAIIGAAVGGAAGAIIGHQMDQQAKDIEAAVPGATVERVGEGIAVSFPSGILFPYNSSQVMPAGRENLGRLAGILQRNAG
ncbi:MAG: glycine zipper domain-containing protein, partial [Gemmatimonadaceae bacterium]